MKIIRRILLWVLIVLILFFIGASVYIKFYGKDLVEEALSSSLKKEVILGKMAYHFPLGFQVQNVQITQPLDNCKMIRIKKVVAQFSLVAIYQRRFAFDAVVFVEPSVVIKDEKRSEDVSEGEGKVRRQGVIVPPIQPEESAISKTKETLNKNARAEISVKQLIIKRGYLQYKGGMTNKGFSFNLEDVQLKARHLAFPLKDGRSEFNISARLVKEDNPLSGSNVQGIGWVDAIKRDMEVKIEVVEPNGTVGLTAEAVSTNNDMEVKGEVKMHNLLKGMSNKGSSDTSTVNDLVLNALSSAGVQIGAKFSFKTKMDDFRIGQVSFSGSVATK